MNFHGNEFVQATTCLGASLVLKKGSSFAAIRLFDVENVWVNELCRIVFKMRLTLDFIISMLLIQKVYSPDFDKITIWKLLRTS